MKFSDLNLIPPILKAAAEAGYEEPSPIQQKAIPPVLAGRDLLGCAQTGTGKTAAFAMPILQRLAAAPAPSGGRPIRALILTPTRELALQIDESFAAYGRHMRLAHCVIFGGVNQNPQVARLKKGVDILTATPGRLNDLIGQGCIDLKNVEIFVLDEADRMLDMGFAEDIMQIVKYLPKERQTIMFSATMPTKIQQLAKTILTNPVEVKLAVSKPAEKIIQAAYICYEAQKLGIIESLFKEQQPERVIIFASSKIKVKEVTKALKRLKLNVGEMHSDLDQSQREAIMHEFRNGRINMLVATDIVARGIDIDDIRLVINYDVPHDSEDYVHRIGRTARANNDGCAITFVSETEQNKFKQIENFLEKEIYKIPVPEELGEAPAYNPRSARPKGKGNSQSASGNKRSSNGNRRRKKKSAPASPSPAKA